MSRSPQWFGASHYDQVDASFGREVADIAPGVDDAKDVFLATKVRLGKATYLVAPSAKSIPPTIDHIKEREEDATRRDVHEEASNGADKDAVVIPDTIVPDGDGLSHRRSIPASSTQPAGDLPAPAPPSDTTPPGTETSAKAGGHAAKLGQWPSTAICANDITSSCFYAISITVQSGGIWAPLCFLIVVGVLYLFRKVYGEAVTALPLNGGAYNVLLNTTNKKTAAFAGCLSLLSYMATGVVSAASAISYLQYIVPAIPTSVGVIILLGVFAALTLWGIKDSSRVAYAIMVTHISTVAVLAITMIVFLCRHPSEQQFSSNTSSDVNPSVGVALLYGYASAMLGVSGFETSANFVEEQQDGVFVKTLRNMWVLVSCINAPLALLTVLVLPLDTVVSSGVENVLLSYLGEVTGGAWLKYWVAIDAFLVLAASVLTAFVGMNGLARRVALDRGLPQILLRTNRWRHTNQYIILSFLAICVVLYFIVNGDVDQLGNVYSISFLLVMSSFAIGNMLLKYNRGNLKRGVRASWFTVILALVLVLLALAGVIAKDPTILAVWVIFFIVVLSAVGLMFFRVRLLHISYYAVLHLSQRAGKPDNPLLGYIQRLVKEFSGTPTAFLTKYGRLPVLNQAVLYILSNEEASHLFFVHLYQDEALIPPKLLRHVSILDQEYPALTVELVLVKGQFDVDTVDWISNQLDVSKNMVSAPSSSAQRYVVAATCCCWLTRHSLSLLPWLWLCRCSSAVRMKGSR